MIDPKLDGRVALVTGGNCGIGEAIAVGLAAQGVRVVVSYLRLDEASHGVGLPDSYGEQRARSGESVAEIIHEAGGQALAVESDLALPDTIPALFDRAESEFGPVEILVHNASSWLADSFVSQQGDRFERSCAPVSAETHDRQFAVDARAGGALIAELAKRHHARGADWGRILALTSDGREGFAGEVSYGAAKAALESYVKSAALELGRDGITANLVHPPVTDTGWLNEAVAAELRDASPLAHIGLPAEVAEVIVFLASHQARFVTGNVVQMR